MSLKSQYQSEQKAEADGVWNDFGAFRVRLARAGGTNSAYKLALERRVKPLQRRLNSLTNDESETIMRELLVDHCIKGWQTRVDDTWQDGIEFEAGQLLDVTRDNLLTVLKQLPDLERELQQCSQDQAAYRQELLEAAAGNSAKS